MAFGEICFVRFIVFAIALNGFVSAEFERNPPPNVPLGAVGLVLGMLEGGMREEEILVEYPSLEPADIRACLAYASELTRVPRGTGPSE